MKKVELVFDADCPNKDAAIDRVREALASAGLPPNWKEWNRSDPKSSPHVRRFGSPTVLVDGRDVAGTEPGEEASSCRLYAGSGGGFTGAPALEDIVAALRPGPPQRRWRGAFAALPAVGASLLPIGTCPACWPAYAGLLGSLGLGFLFSSTYLMPLMAAMLGITVASLAFGANSRRGFGPFTLGLVGAAVALVGKFALSLNLVLYAGIGLLVAGSVWNSWPRNATTTDSCPTCARQEGQLNT